MLGERDEVDTGILHTSFQRPSPAFLQNLRYALAAADYGSFRRAAEALLLRQVVHAQPLCPSARGIDRHGRLRRSSGGVRATHTGRQFLRSARSILGAGGSAGGENAEYGPRRGRPAYGRVYTSLAAGNLRAYADRMFPNGFRSSSSKCSRAHAPGSSQRCETRWSTLRLFRGPRRCRN